jgi:hypothetical protein
MVVGAFGDPDAALHDMDLELVRQEIVSGMRYFYTTDLSQQLINIHRISSHQHIPPARDTANLLTSLQRT